MKKGWKETLAAVVLATSSLSGSLRSYGTPTNRENLEQAQPWHTIWAESITPKDFAMSSDTDSEEANKSKDLCQSEKHEDQAQCKKIGDRACQLVDLLQWKGKCYETLYFQLIDADVDNASALRELGGMGRGFITLFTGMLKMDERRAQLLRGANPDDLTLSMIAHELIHLHMRHAEQRKEIAISVSDKFKNACVAHLYPKSPLNAWCKKQLVPLWPDLDRESEARREREKEADIGAMYLLASAGVSPIASMQWQFLYGVTHTGKMLFSPGGYGVPVGSYGRVELITHPSFQERIDAMAPHLEGTQKIANKEVRCPPLPVILKALKDNDFKPVVDKMCWATP